MEKKNIKEELQEVIETVIQKMDKPDSEKKEHENLLNKILKEGKLPYEAMGMNDEMMEVIYTQGYQVYHNGQFDMAQATFHMLTLLNPIEGKYHLALGAAYHQQKKYEKAINSYMAAAEAGESPALALYYAADCYLNMGDNNCAAFALNGMLDEMECDPASITDPLSTVMRERGKVLLEVIKKDLCQKNSTKKTTKKQ